MNAPTPAGPSEAVGPGRPMQADARRNHERLVVAAREVFAQEGGGASMEAIARRAGVGVGTATSPIGSAWLRPSTAPTSTILSELQSRSPQILSRGQRLWPSSRRS